jgi:predicted ATPase
MLRFIGLLWALLDGTGPLLIEHPEQSLHPAVVRYLPGMVWRAPRWSRRQVFVSTHSAEMILDEGIGLDEVLILQPGEHGTSIWGAFELVDIRILREGGMPLTDIIRPWTAPKDAYEIALVGS